MLLKRVHFGHNPNLFSCAGGEWEVWALQKVDIYMYMSPRGTQLQMHCYEYFTQCGSSSDGEELSVDP